MNKMLIRSIIFLSSIALVTNADDPTTNDVVNLSSDQIAKLRRFKSENVYVTSKDGYEINLVHIFPVKETNKRPVIFNHGSTQSSTYFMTNSVDARPKDYSKIDLGSITDDELEQLLLNDPQTTSLPLLLVSFGHHVYLINRRGTEFSLGKVGSSKSNPITSSIDSLTNPLLEGLGSLTDLAKLIPESRLDSANQHFIGRDSSSEIQSNDDGILDRSILSDFGSRINSFLSLFLKPQLNVGSLGNTLDSSYWNFSLDEQAKYDLPAIITYVQEQTNSKKVAYVGHSLGSALMFMLQSEQPQWSEVVEPFVAWSPDVYLGHTTSILRPLLVALQPLLSNAPPMPFPPTPIDPLTRTLLASLCQTKIAQDTICLLLDGAMFGFSGKQQRTLPAFVASQFYSVSSYEAVQLAQNAEKGKMYHYDFGSATKNKAAYGQSEAPIYDLSKINSKSIYFWRGEKDALATPTDVDILKGDLSVSVVDNFITEIPFSHYDLLFGKNVTQLVNIPTLKTIESYN